MTSLYRRATPRQKKVLLMIEGACHNAAHAHPKWEFDPRLATSIAKRAAGTLTAQWPDVLAASPSMRSDRDGEPGQALSVAPGGAGVGLSSGDGSVQTTGRRSRGASRVTWRAPLGSLHRAIGNAVSAAKRDGQTERAEALIDVLRLIAEVMAADRPPPRQMKLFLQQGK